MSRPPPLSACSTCFRQPRSTMPSSGSTETGSHSSAASSPASRVSISVVFLKPTGILEALHKASCLPGLARTACRAVVCSWGPSVAWVARSLFADPGPSAKIGSPAPRSFQSSVASREDHLGPLGWALVCPGRAPCARRAAAHSASLLGTFPTTMPPIRHAVSGATTWEMVVKPQGRRGGCFFLYTLTRGAGRQRPGARAVWHKGKRSSEPCHQVESIHSDQE